MSPCEQASAPVWGDLFKVRPTDLVVITKPAQWMRYEHPFIYGQPDTSLFPMEQWRDAARKVMGSW